MTAKNANPKSKRVTTRPMAKPAPASVSGSVGIERNGKPSEEDIRVRAYEKWEAAGRPDGDGTQFWLQAEQELMQIG